VENFFVVQQTSALNAGHRSKAVEIRDIRSSGQAELPQLTARTKDPSGGTTGRVKLYGRLGWMGARAEYSFDGEGLPLPQILCRGRGPERSTEFAIFFDFFAGLFGGNLDLNYCAAGRSAS
jgi:hypothetical protein